MIRDAEGLVVLHPLSTSNHNFDRGERHSRKLYCILFLHQTTTREGLEKRIVQLYCILFLHQTTTITISSCIMVLLYCILFLHQTTTPQARIRGHRELYCILFLHQTTTTLGDMSPGACCIASSFYIKPQLRDPLSGRAYVVLHPLSTSNHNPRTPDTLIFGHLTASRHDTKRGGVHRGSRFDAVFTFSTNIRKIIFTEIRRCMSVQRAGARLRSDSSEANI